MARLSPAAKLIRFTIIFGLPWLSLAQDNSSSDSSSSVATIVAALGTIVGYIGSDTVDVEIFERLLWPERFYNHVTPITLIKFALFFTM